MKFIAQLVGIIALLFASKALADGVEITQAQVRQLPPGVPNTSAYFVVRNTTDEDVLLVGGKTEIAARVELHSHESDGELMRMVRQDSVRVPAGGKVTFQPGGLHLMLFELKQPLHANQQVSISLHSDKGDKFTFTAQVQPPGQQHHHHH